MKLLHFHTTDGPVFINPLHVDALKADGDYTNIYLRGTYIKVTSTLAQVSLDLERALNHTTYEQTNSQRQAS